MKYAVSSTLFAGILLTVVSAYSSQERQYKLEKDGTEHTFQLTAYTNEHGQREVAVGLQEVRRLLPDSTFTVLYGRDTDFDQYYDLWFYPTEDGEMKTVARVAKSKDGWDAIEPILFYVAQTEKRWFLSLMFSKIAGSVSFTYGWGIESLSQAARMEMDLLDLQHRYNRAKKNGALHPRQMIAISEEIARGWLHLAQELNSDSKKSLIMAPLLDTAAYLSGYQVFRFMRWAAGGASKVVGAVFPAAQETLESWAQHWIGKKVSWLFSKAGEAKTQAKAATRGALHKVSGGADDKIVEYASKFTALLAKASPSERIALIVRMMESRNRLGMQVAKSLRTGVEIAKAGGSRWKYIALAQSIQVAVEAATRRDQIFTSSDPLVIAKNVANNKELIQNVAYMTNETFLMSAISTFMKSVPKRMAICGLVSLVDSLAMSILIKGETDPTRIGFDTGWEVVVGNGQVQVDVIALSHFEELAKRNRDPKMLLVGYAIALGNQTLGYAGYSIMTQKLGESEPEPQEPEVSAPVDEAPEAHLVPIFAPALP